MQIIIGILGLALIVFVHELGHFLAAKYYKVEVVEFAVGMGPKLWSFTMGSTVYSLRLLPLGGFCRLKSEHEAASAQAMAADANAVIPKTPGTLFMLSAPKKAVVLLAGPAANIVWYALMSLVLYFGNFSVSDLPPRIDPAPGSPAAAAGLQPGDTITAIGATPVASFSHIAEAARAQAGNTAAVTFTRAGAAQQQSAQVSFNADAPFLGAYPFVEPVVEYVTKKPAAKNKTNTAENTTAAENAANQFMKGDRILSVEKTPISNAVYFWSEMEKYAGYSASVVVLRGTRELTLVVPVAKNNAAAQLGVGFASVRIKQWNTFGEFVSSRVAQMASMVTSTAAFLGRLVIPKQAAQTDVAGPVRIISILGGNTVVSAQTEGISYALLQFIGMSALISFAIAIMNLLPIPVLDGGQIAFYAVYAALKKQPTYRALARYQSAGVVLMLALFIFVMYKDIASFF